MDGADSRLKRRVLRPGVRRLPGADWLAHLAHLIGELENWKRQFIGLQERRGLATLPCFLNMLLRKQFEAGLVFAALTQRRAHACGKVE